MKKFLVVYKSSMPAAQQMASMTPEQGKAGMDMWMTWAKRAGSAIVDLGSPVGNAIKLTGPGKRANSASQAGGFSILQADSADALAKLLDGHPHFMAPGASIEVHEMLQMPGM